MALNPGTLIDGARMYAAAADSVNNDYPNALHVLSHLLGMSIELSLKAFLCSKGATERELRKYGHDLGLLLKRAEALGLTKTGSRHFRLNVLGANYEERLFAYPKPAVLTIILPAGLREITHEIISEVFVSIKGEELYDKLRDEPGLSIRAIYPDELDASNWANER
jgi:hypothetical protein